MRRAGLTTSRVVEEAEKVADECGLEKLTPAAVARKQDEVEDTGASNGVLDVVYAILGDYRLEGDDAVNAVRLLRAHFHGFVSLERAEGFKFPNDIDHSFELLIGALDQILRNWTPEIIDPVR